MKKILVFAQSTETTWSKATLGLLTLASTIGEVSVGLSEVITDELLNGLAEHGASTIYVNVNEKLSVHGTAAKADFLAQLITLVGPDALLLETSADNKEISGRIAVLSDGGVLTDISALVVDESGRLIATQEIFGGSTTVTSWVTQGPAILTVRPNNLSVQTNAKDFTLVEVFADLADSTQALTVVPGPRVEMNSRPKLTEAKIIVGAGRGVGNQENFENIVERLADTLGAAVGASRAAIDAEWCPSNLLVGQSGTTVSPELYIALGISGAIHHRAGMQGARCIVAIDVDENAPMLHNADLGIVGDIGEIVPKLIEMLNNRK